MINTHTAEFGLSLHLRRVLLVVASLLLYACDSAGSHDDLRTYITKTKMRPAGSIKPLEAPRPYEAYVYKATAMRSPFERPVDVTQRIFTQGSSEVKPDNIRVKEFLEDFDLSGLKMSGSIEKAGKLWALISDETGRVHWVTDGNYLGKNHGKIVEATEQKIDIVEIVSNGLDGWIERPRVLALSEQEL
ncbi:MAG: pilus assembly protein PilP [Alteromonadaceae bacterium]|nr:MAG: pilus assembly protein PilP [Alteromonadaceae bacterium]